MPEIMSSAQVDEVAPVPDQKPVETNPSTALPLPPPAGQPYESFAIDDGQSARSQVRVSVILAALYMALFISAMDHTVVVTALPTIANHFHSAAGYTWVGAAYGLAETASGPVWTNFSDIWGRKPVILVAVFLFMISSLICGLSTSMGMLIVGRCIQGAAAGGNFLLVNVIISDMFDMRRRSLYLGLCELIWALSGAAGPIIGGAFAEYVSWRWIWYINLPIGAASFGGLFFFLNIHNPRTPVWRGLKAVDWLGSLALLAVTLMTFLGLNYGGETLDWTSPKVLVLITVGVSISAVFFFVEAKVAKYPVMPLSVFKNVSNAAAIAVAGTHSFAMMGPQYYLTLYFQAAKLARPLRAGLLGLPFVFLEGVGGIVGGVIINRTGRYNTLLWVGAVITTLGFGLLIDLNTSSGLDKIIIYQFIGALGSGLLLQPPLIAIQANVTQQDTSTATSTLNFMQALAQAVSIVIGAVVFQSSMNLKSPDLLKAGLPPELVKTFSGEDAQANVERLRAMTNIMNRELIQDAYAWSLRNAWILFTAVSALTLVANFFVGTHPLSTEHVETRTGLEHRDSKDS